MSFIKTVFALLLMFLLLYGGLRTVELNGRELMAKNHPLESAAVEIEEGEIIIVFAGEKLVIPYIKYFPVK